MYGILPDGRILRLEDTTDNQRTIIPKDMGNGDYIKFLIWLKDENVPISVGSPEITLEQAKSTAREALKNYAASLRDQAIGTVSPGEAASWLIKEQEGRKFRETNDPQDAPLLATEASIRQIALSDLVDKVLTNADQLKMLEAVIAGTRGYHDDRIAALATIEGVQAYRWTDTPWLPTNIDSSSV